MKVALLVPDNRDEFRRYDVSAPYFGPAPTALLEGFQAHADCEVHVVCCVHKVMPSPPRLGENVFFHSVRVGKWGWMRTSYAGCVYAIRKILRGIKPDIVHGQGTERYCGLAAVYSGLPNVITIHGNMIRMAEFACTTSQRLFYRGAALLEEHVLARTAGVFCNSQHTEALVRRRTANVWRVPNAVQSLFLHNVPVGPPRRPPVFLNIGHIAPHKRQLELLRHLRRSNLRSTPFRLAFIGKADASSAYGAMFMDEVAAAEREGFAAMHGEMDASAIVHALDSAAGLIHCAAEEAFGLVVAEALARNKKVFAFATGGIPDVVEGHRDAELFEDGDWDGIFHRLNSWVNEGLPMPCDASELARRRFAPEVVAERHLAIYNEVLSKT